MATMSTASRTAWTSCGVRLTLPRGMVGESTQRGSGSVSRGFPLGEGPKSMSPRSLGPSPKGRPRETDPLPTARPYRAFLGTARAVAQGHHRRAVAALVRGAGMRFPDRGVAPQVLADRLAQAAGAVAVDHPHLAPRGQQCAVEIAVELLEGGLDAHADQVDLGRHRRGLVQVP